MDNLDKAQCYLDRASCAFSCTLVSFVIALFCFSVVWIFAAKSTEEKKIYIPQHVSISVEKSTSGVDIRQLRIDDDSIKWEGRFKIEGKIWRSISWPEEEYKTCSDLTVIEDDDILILEGSLLWIGDVHIEINKKDIKENNES